VLAKSVTASSERSGNLACVISWMIVSSLSTPAALSRIRTRLFVQSQSPHRSGYRFATYSSRHQCRRMWTRSRFAIFRRGMGTSGQNHGNPSTPKNQPMPSRFPSLLRAACRLSQPHGLPSTRDTSSFVIPTDASPAATMSPRPGDAGFGGGLHLRNVGSTRATWPHVVQVRVFGS